MRFDTNFFNLSDTFANRPWSLFDDMTFFWIRCSRISRARNSFSSSSSVWRTLKTLKTPVTKSPEHIELTTSLILITMSRPLTSISRNTLTTRASRLSPSSCCCWLNSLNGFEYFARKNRRLKKMFYFTKSPLLPQGRYPHHRQRRTSLREPWTRTWSCSSSLMLWLT